MFLELIISVSVFVFLAIVVVLWQPTRTILIEIFTHPFSDSKIEIDDPEFSNNSSKTKATNYEKPNANHARV